MNKIKGHKYNFEKISDYNAFQSLEGDWNRLAGKHGSIYPFICFEWFDEWFKAFLKKESLYICVLSDQISIRAIAPFIQDKSIIGSAIRFAVNGHTPKIELISDKIDLPGYVERLFYELYKESFFYIYLEDLSSISDNATLILNYLSKNMHKYIYDKRFIRESVVIDTSMGWDNVKKTLSKNFRKNINHQKNKMYKAGAVRIIKYTQQEHLPNAFECIEKISSKSWQGRLGKGLFSREDTKSFYKGFGETACRKGLLTIWVLYLDGQPLAYEYHITIGEVDYALKAEYDQDYSELSPGAVLDAYVVRKLSEGATEKYNLLGHKEPYKTRWSKQSEKYIRIYINKYNLFGTVYHFVDFPLRARLKRYRFLRSVKKSIFK